MFLKKTVFHFDPNCLIQHDSTILSWIPKADTVAPRQFYFSVNQMRKTSRIALCCKIMDSINPKFFKTEKTYRWQFGNFLLGKFFFQSTVETAILTPT